MILSTSFTHSSLEERFSERCHSLMWDLKSPHWKRIKGSNSLKNAWKLRWLRLGFASLAQAFKAHVRFLFIRATRANDDSISGSSRIGVEAEGWFPGAWVPQGTACYILAPVMMTDVPASGSFSRGTGKNGDSEDGELVLKTHCLDISSSEGSLIHSLVASSPAWDYAAWKPRCDIYVLSWRYTFYLFHRDLCVLGL